MIEKLELLRAVGRDYKGSAAVFLCRIEATMVCRLPRLVGERGRDERQRGREAEESRGETERRRSKRKERGGQCQFFENGTDKHKCRRQIKGIRTRRHGAVCCGGARSGPI